MQSEPSTSYNFGSASGYTESRLEEILPYNFSGDYSTISGATVFDDHWVRYQLDGVTYETDISSTEKVTRFFLDYDSQRDKFENFEDSLLIHYDHRPELQAPIEVKNGVFFQRPSFTALQMHQKLATLRNLGMVRRYMGD